jgi:hypothetical protein
MVSGGAQPAQSSIACTAGACHPSYMMPTVGIDADAGEEEAAAAKIIIRVVFMPALVQVRRQCWVCCSVTNASSRQ